MICAVFWVKVHEKIKFFTTTFNFSLTVTFCITVKTQKIRSKYGQKTTSPDLCAAAIWCTWFSASYFPVTELLAIKAVPASRGMKSSVPRIWIEAFQCLISLKTWLIWCSHGLPVHNKTRSLMKSSWSHFFSFLKVCNGVIFIISLHVSQTCALCTADLKNWPSGWYKCERDSLIANKFPRVFHKTVGWQRPGLNSVHVSQIFLLNHLFSLCYNVNFNCHH